MKFPPVRSKNRRSAITKAAFRRALLVCEQLEGRQLLAADTMPSVCFEEPASVASQVAAPQKVDDIAEQKLAMPAASHQYLVGTDPVEMHIHPTRIALSVVEGIDARAVLAANGFQHVRRVDSEFRIYEAPNAEELAATLKAGGIVAEAVPVFVLQETNSEAVLIDELIVSLRPGVKAQEFFADNEAFSGYRRLDGTPNQFVATVAAGRGAAAMQVLNELQATKPADIQWIEPNFYENWQRNYIPNDPRFGNQWHLHNTGQGGATVDADSDLPEAWDLNQGGSSAYVIGVIDDSVEAHPDLNLWVNPGEIAGNGIDDDANGWVDDINGWNFTANNNASQPSFVEEAHGTAVAGVAAARGNNAVGVAGASFNSMVSSAKIFTGDGTGEVGDVVATNTANIASALYYMGGRTADGLGTWKSADLVNNSWSGGGVSTAINDALTWGTTSGRQGAGTPYFFATGNGFSGTVNQPAAQSVNIPGVFAIGATNSAGVRSDYSNFGTALDFVAPSDNFAGGFLAIDTTDRAGEFGYNLGFGDPDPNYTGTGSSGFGGTSSATPLSVGIAALVMDQADDLGVVLSPADLRNYLRQTTDLIGGVSYSGATGKHAEYGFGRLNARTAVAGIGVAEISIISSAGDMVSGSSVIDVGGVYAGETFDLTVRVRNQGTSTLDLTSLAITSGDFSISSGFGDSSLSVGEATTFVVSYSPMASGSDSATVTVMSSDTDEGTFTFEVIGLGLIRSISGNVVEDWDGDGAIDPQDTPLVSQLVYLDANENGIYDNVVSEFSSTTVVPIVDNQTVSSTIAVSGMSAIEDLNVTVNITHTWNSDMVGELVSPTGTRIRLFDRVGGSTDNFVNTVFDDEASTAIAAGTAPFTGSFRPTQPLSAADGTDPNGTWTFEVSDLAGGDVGTINSWTLSFTNGEQATGTNSTGYYFFENLPSGTYQVRSHAANGWEATGDNLHEVTIATPEDFFIDVDFGQAADNRFYGLVFADENSDGVFDSAEMPLEARTLFIDTNGDGMLTGGTVGYLFDTATTIPDTGTVTVTQAVSGVAGPITDVDVRLTINHTWNSDLDVFLIHPDGTRVELFTDVGGSTINFVDTVLDDEAATSITTGTGPFTGSFRPEGLLSTLDGKVGDGTWSLELSDDAAEDIGTLVEWELFISSGEISTLTDNLGRASFDFAVGTHEVYLAPTEGWSHTVPSDGHRTAVVADAPLVNQTFGSIDVPADTVPPTLTAPMIAGTTWPAEFLDFVDGGTNLGMPLTTGMQPLVFNDLNRLFLQFSEDVQNVNTTTIELRNSTSVVPISVSYDSSTFRATISLAAPLPFNKYRLAASTQITDAAGNPLDGNGSGGILNFRFDVLPADTSGNGRVGTEDLLGFGASFGAQAGQANYNLRLDWTADARVNTTDLTVFSPMFGSRIDNMSEPGAPFGGGGGGSLASTRGSGWSVPYDSFFKELGEDDEDEDKGLELL